MGLAGMLHTHFSPWTAGRELSSCGVDGTPSGVISATAVGEGDFWCTLCNVYHLDLPYGMGPTVGHIGH